MNKSDKVAREYFERMKSEYEEKGVTFDEWDYLFFNSIDKPFKRNHYVHAAFKLDEDIRITCTGDINTGYLYAFNIEYSGQLEHKDCMKEIPLICNEIKRLWQQAKAVKAKQ